MLQLQFVSVISYQIWIIATILYMQGCADSMLDNSDPIYKDEAKGIQIVILSYILAHVYSWCRNAYHSVFYHWCS